MYCKDCHGVQGPQGPYTCHCGQVDNYYYEWIEEFASLVASRIWFYEPKTFVETKDRVLELLVNLEHEVKKLKFFKN